MHEPNTKRAVAFDWSTVSEDDAASFPPRAAPESSGINLRMERPAQGAELGRGSLFAGRYLIERYVAHGGMGSVWAATDLKAEDERHRHVALKVMTAWSEAGEPARERFRREAALASGLRGAQFPEMLGYGVEGSLPYMALELLEGETLAQRLKTRGLLTPRECLDLLKQIAEGLTVAHSFGVVHRDITPKNLMISEPLEPFADEIVKILDFGIAKHALFDAKLTEPGTLMGSPHYISPEQVRSSSNVDARSDLWSVGAVLYRCLLGRRPFDGNLMTVLLDISRSDPTRPSTIAPRLGAAVDEFFETALAKDPTRRFARADLMLAAFEAAVARLPDDAVPRHEIVDEASTPDEDAGRTVCAKPGYDEFAAHASKSRRFESDAPTGERHASDMPTAQVSLPIAMALGLQPPSTYVAPAPGPASAERGALGRARESLQVRSVRLTAAILFGLLFGLLTIAALTAWME